MDFVKKPASLREGLLVGGVVVGVATLTAQALFFARAAYRLWAHFLPQWRDMRALLDGSKEGYELAHSLQFYDLPLSFLLSNRGFWFVAREYLLRETVGRLAALVPFGRRGSTEAAHGLHMFYYVPYAAQPLDRANPTKWRHVGLTQTPWVDPSRLGDVGDVLRTNAARIRDEYRAAMDKTVQEHPDWADAGKGKGRWGWSELYGARGWSERCTTHLPHTYEVVRGLDVCLNFGFVFFSELRPDSHIQAHTGSGNVRTRVHLGIDLPNGEGHSAITGETTPPEKPYAPEQVQMKVGGIAQNWRQDDIIVFDDSFVHEAYNFSSQKRTVLIIDLWHPDLSDREKEILNNPLFHKFGRLP